MGNARACQPRQQDGASIFAPHGEPLELRESPEIADSGATCGVSINRAEKMRGAKIIAVKFFVKRRRLLGNVRRAAYREYLEKHIDRGDGLNVDLAIAPLQRKEAL